MAAAELATRVIARSPTRRSESGACTPGRTPERPSIRDIVEWETAGHAIARLRREAEVRDEELAALHERIETASMS